MIITKQKELKEILKYLEGQNKIFIVGCGECSTTCKTGGEEDLKRLKEALEKEGKTVTGYCVPEAPCIAAKVKLELAKNRKTIESSDEVLILACGLGIQSVKENLRSEKPVHVGCDTLFMGAIDSGNTFLEKCSACGDCVLELTGLICPITRCSKSLMNGPCGGQDKGKCEVDKTRDCAWILIYNELKKQNKLALLKELKPPRDHSKSTKPRQRLVASVLIALTLFSSSLLYAQEKLWGELQEEAIVLYQEKKHREAVEMQCRALKIAEETFGADSLNVAESLDNLAIYNQAMGNNAEAENLYERALAIMEKKLPPNDHYLAIFMDYLAGFYEKIGKAEEGRRMRERAKAIRSAG